MRYTYVTFLKCHCKKVIEFWDEAWEMGIGMENGEWGTGNGDVVFEDASMFTKQPWKKIPLRG